MVQSKLLLKFPKIRHYFFDKNDPVINKGYLDIIKNCVFPEQKHTNNVVFVQRKKRKYLNCDGLVTDRNLFLGVKTADCLPILFYEPVRNIIAIVHAGWRGLLDGIVSNGIKILVKRGADKRKLLAVIGPHIGPCCYKVHHERIIQFEKKFGYQTKKNQQGEWHLDLAEIAAIIMNKFGMDKNNIDILKENCTCCNLHYSSYRREGDNSSRMWSVIGLI